MAIAGYVDSFVNGDFDPALTHWVLIGVIVSTEIGLGIGIWLESPKNKSCREWAGVVLVMGGCIISAVFTVLLLMFDEGISHAQQSIIDAQQSKIISLEKIAIPRRWYGPLMGQMRGAPTATALSQSMDVVANLFKYPGTVALIEVVPEYGAERLAAMIKSGLTLAGWKPETLTPGKSGIPNSAVPDGVQLWTSATHDVAWNAAEALASSLASEGIDSDAPGRKLHLDDPHSAMLPSGDIRLTPPAGTVIILVGEKPAFGQLGKAMSEEYRAAHPDEK